MKLTALTALAHEIAVCRVVAAEDLRQRGADSAVIQLARKRGVLQSLPGIHGVYVVGAAPPDPTTLLHVASRYAGPRAIVSGLWAARAQGLSWVPAGGDCLVRIEAGRRRSSDGFISICRTVQLERIATWQQDGVTFATPPYAVVDACRQVQADPGRSPRHRLRDVRGLVLGAIAQNRCTVEELEAVLAHSSIRHTADTRRALEDAARGAASPPEAEVVDDLLSYGVPFLCNVEVWVDAALIGILDFYLVGTGVGGEMDSVQEHAAEEKLGATLARHERFADLDVALRHVTPTQYRQDPTAYHSRLFAAARARLTAGRGDPIGVHLVPRGPLLCGPRSDLTPYELPTRSRAA